MIPGGYNILLVDDSAIALEYAQRQLEPGGHHVETVIDARETLGRLAELNPDVVILDIMMPFINGFELCKKIRSDQKFEKTTIIMVSTKAYEADREKAMRMGADGYIVKPFSLERFDAIMNDLGCLKLSAWGVRGTLPMPQEGYIEFGGNTSCYSVQLSTNRHIVLDAGTGIKGLSNALLNSSPNRFDLDLLITHPHWDHIHGFPFFAPLYMPGNEIQIFGSAQEELSLENLLTGQMDGTHFPATIREFSAHIRFHELSEEEFQLGEVTVKTMLLKHPGNCLGYRIDLHGRSLCYITDNELYLPDSEHADEEFMERLADFCRGTNVLIHDSTYFDEQYVKHVHWGHSALSQVCRLAHLADAERLWIHHHDPDQTDEDIAQKLVFCRERLDEMGSSTRAILPHEGMTDRV